MSFQRGFAPIVFLLILLVFASIAGVGYYYAAKNQKPASPVVIQTPLPTSTPISSPDETANWKTYVNTKIGISLKYPESWSVNDANDVGIYLDPPTTGNSEDWFTLIITTYGNPNNLSAEDYYKQFIEMRRKDQNTNANNNPQAVEINNKVAQSALAAIKPYQNSVIKGIIVETVGYEQPTITIISKSLTGFIQFKLVPGNGTGASINENQRTMLSKIISTVKFTDQTSASQAPGQKVCQSDADCSSDEVCTQAGPIAIDPATGKTLNKKTCWPKGAAIPL